MKGDPLASLDPGLLDPEIQEVLRELGRNGGWSAYDGPFLESLHEELAGRFDRRYVQACCSGTFAIELALRGCRIGPGDEVLLASYDFPGNFRAIESVGGAIAVVDIPPRGWSFTDVEPLDRMVGPSTRAVIISHLHGTSAPMKAISEWAAVRGLYVIEDACQAPGAVIDGRPAGSWGDCSALSFGGTKLLSAGRGGAVLTNDARIDQRMRIFRERGNDAFPLSELQAAVLVPQLKHLNQRHAMRARYVNDLEKEAAQYPWLVSPPRSTPLDENAFYKWGFQVRSLDRPVVGFRDQVIQAFQQQGIIAGSGFRGFASRSSSRCRRPETLSHAAMAAENTVLVHHTMLAKSLAEALSKVDRQLRAAEFIA